MTYLISVFSVYTKLETLSFGNLIEIRSNLSIFTDQFSEIIHVCTNFNLMIDLLFKQEFSQIFWSADKQVAPWSNKSSLTSVRRNPIKCLWFSSLSLFFVLILLLPLRLFLPPEVHVFQYRLSLPILDAVNTFRWNQQTSETSVIERVWGNPHQDKSHRMTGCQTAILLNMGGSCSYVYPSI